MKQDDHYLRTELYELVRATPAIFEFLQLGVLDGIWYWDLEEPKHEWMSARFWDVLGYNPAQRKHLAAEWQDLIFAEDLATAVDNLERHCANPDHPYDQLARYRHKDGSIVWVRCRGIAIRDAEGKPTRLLGAHTDVTSLKETEEQLKNKTEGLERAEEELQKANNELETRVAERTAELEAANSDLRRLEAKLEAENIFLREEIDGLSVPEDVVGRSHLWKQVLHQVEQVAGSDATVLFLGETGTGKCVLAHHLHSQSARSDRPFVKINCAVLPASLIESELFGHERGAFTGATTAKAGRFELADNGTVFLDEIGDLPLDLQPKLLRVLNDGEFERVGSTKTRKTDVRVIAATNRKLKQALAEGRFREDLYYRLSVFPLELPPLRKRPEDIPLFVWYFLKEFGARHGKQITEVSQKTMAVLRSYSWPGNVRELRNVIERALILSPGSRLMLAPGFEPASTATPAESSVALEDVARAHILQVVEECGWRIRGKGNAAERLGINPSTLRSRMKKMGIERP